MNRSQAFSQVATAAGYFLPKVRVGERGQGCQRGINVNSGVDRNQRRCNGFPVSVDDVAHGSPDQMHYAGLDQGSGSGRFSCFGEPSEPVTAADQHVLEAAVGQLGAHAGPKLRPSQRPGPRSPARV